MGALDLTNCDREPIHIPGSIQPHGVLIVLDPGSLKVIQVAGDTARLLGVTPHELLTHGLEARIGPAALERLRAFSAQDIAIPRPLFAFETGVQYHGHPLEAFVHMSGGTLVIELEPCQSEPSVNPAAIAQDMIMRVHGEAELPGFFQAVANEVRGATGFDRVMVYQFQKDDSGAVIAEAKAEDSGALSWAALPGFRHSQASPRTLSAQLDAAHSRCALHPRSGYACVESPYRQSSGPNL